MNPKLESALKELFFDHTTRFFSYYLGYFQFIEDEKVKSACVGVKDLKLTIWYNPKMVDVLHAQHKLAMVGILIHEALHPLLNHQDRTKNHGANHQLANYVQDIIIDPLTIKKYYPHIPYPIVADELIEAVGLMGFEKGKEWCIVPDPNYTGPEAFEPMYEWYKKKNQDQINQYFKDLHMTMDEVAQEVMRQLAGEAYQRAKTRGTCPGGLQEMLDRALHPPKKDNLRRLIARSLAACKGLTKRKTYAREARKIAETKGRVKEAVGLTALLDTSGSMWGDSIEVVLSELYRDGYYVNLIQVDTKVNGINKIAKKEQLRKLILNGGGGTVLQPGLDYVVEKKMKAPIVILTDGYCDHLTLPPVQVLIISCGQKVEYTGGRNVKQVLVKAND